MYENLSDYPRFPIPSGYFDEQRDDPTHTYLKCVETDFEALIEEAVYDKNVLHLFAGEAGREALEAHGIKKVTIQCKNVFEDELFDDYPFETYTYEVESYKLEKV